MRNNHKPSSQQVQIHFGLKDGNKAFTITHKYRKYIKMRRAMTLKSRRINRQRGK